MVQMKSYSHWWIPSESAGTAWACNMRSCVHIQQPFMAFSQCLYQLLAMPGLTALVQAWRNWWSQQCLSPFAAALVQPVFLDFPKCSASLWDGVRGTGKTPKKPLLIQRAVRINPKGSRKLLQVNKLNCKGKWKIIHIFDNSAAMSSLGTTDNKHINLLCPKFTLIFRKGKPQINLVTIESSLELKIHTV